MNWRFDSSFLTQKLVSITSCLPGTTLGSWEAIKAAAAAIAAKSLQSLSDSVQPHRRQPTRLPRPWDSPGKNTGVGCPFLLQYMKGKVKVKSLSHVRLLATPWTAAHQAPLSVGFSRWEYWSGVPLPCPIKVGIAAKNQLWRAAHPNSPDRATGWSVCTEKAF